MPHNQNTPTPTNTPEALQRLIIEAAVLKRLYAAHADYKQQVAKHFTPGDKRAVKNPQGLNIGSVSMSAPNKLAVCEDRQILLAEAKERGMEIIDALPATDSEAGQEAIAVLLEHAPHLLASDVSKEDREEIAGTVLEHWQITGAIPTGWTIEDASAPRFSITPGRSKPAQAAIEHLVGEIETILTPKAITTGKDEQ